MYQIKVTLKSGEILVLDEKYTTLIDCKNECEKISKCYSVLYTEIILSE